MDEICNIAVPVFKAAIDDLDQLPKDWPDGASAVVRGRVRAEEAVWTGNLISLTAG